MKTKMLGIFVCTLMIAATVLPVAGTMINRNVSDDSSNKDTDWWPMFQHDPQLTGFSSSNAPNTNNVLWSYSTGELNQLSSPAVVDGKLYVGTAWESEGYKNSGLDFLTVLHKGKTIPQQLGGTIYCLDAVTGSLIWTFIIDDLAVVSTLAIVDGKVYATAIELDVGPGNTTLYCLDADNGDEIWDFTLGMFSICSPIVVDGKVYFGGIDRVTDYGKLWCLDPGDGSIEWTYTMNYMETIYASSPAVADGKVYASVINMSAGDGTLYCLDADNGDKIWDFTPVVGTFCSPAVEDGKVYFGGANETGCGKLWCLDADDGGIEWTYTIGYQEYMFFNSPAVAYDKVLALTFNQSGLEENGTVYCVDADTGDEIWRFTLEGQSYSSPAVADGKTYFGSTLVGEESIGKFYCLDIDDGSLIWTYVLDNATLTSFTVADWRAYCVSIDGIIYAFQDSNDPPTAPTITGETSGKAGKEYEYTFNATDPDGDDVRYFIDWGDNDTEWTGFNASGTDVKVKHTWSKKGDYTITAKAQDIYDAEGPEGTLDITMPKNKAFNFNILEWFFERFLNAFPILRQLLGL